MEEARRAPRRRRARMAPARDGARKPVLREAAARGPAPAHLRAHAYRRDHRVLEYPRVDRAREGSRCRRTRGGGREGCTEGRGVRRLRRVRAAPAHRRAGLGRRLRGVRVLQGTRRSLAVNASPPLTLIIAGVRAAHLWTLRSRQCTRAFGHPDCAPLPQSRQSRVQAAAGRAGLRDRLRDHGRPALSSIPDAREQPTSELRGDRGARANAARTAHGIPHRPRAARARRVHRRRRDSEPRARADRQLRRCWRTGDPEPGRRRVLRPKRRSEWFPSSFGMLF